jgi:hypothetical protein
MKPFLTIVAAMAVVAGSAFADSDRTLIKGPDSGEVICQESGGSLEIKRVVCLFKDYENRSAKPQTYLFPLPFAARPARLIGPMPPLSSDETRATLPLPTLTKGPVGGWIVLEGF